ncbi:MAG: proprotein convertase P-domain-containing protein [Phycisphaerae bacterium]
MARGDNVSTGRVRRAGRCTRADLLENLESRILLSVAPTIMIKWRSARNLHKTPAVHGAKASPIAIVRRTAKHASALVPGTALTPAQVRKAYGFDQISFGNIIGDGSGQTIAIIDAYDSPTVANDLHQFDLEFGLPDPPSFRRVAQDGTTNFPPVDPAGPGAAGGTWEEETALDVEWAHAIAPGANILLVEASDDSFTNLIDHAAAWATTQPDVTAVSMSFGGGEFPSETNEDAFLATPEGHQGITFIAATGDKGSPGGYPAYSPGVLAVGGTTLTLDASGNYQGESAWSGSGGGVSFLESQPLYQRGIAAGFSTSRRSTPDVSMVADPNTGVAIYDSYDFPSSPWLQIGGTSLSSPIWAGLIAIADQGRAANSLPSLDGESQTLPMLYRLPASDFHDVTTGASTNGQNPPTINSAQPGYDLATGRGSPIADKVVFGLIGTSSISGAVFQDNNSNGIQDAADDAIAGTTVFIDSNGNGVLDTGVTASLSNTTSRTILDNSARGATSAITVAGTTHAISNVTVTLNITHPRDSDLTVTLQAPGGIQIMLLSGLTGVNFNNTVLCDQADQGIESGSGSFTGTYRSTDALADFNGFSANGTWNLKVVDGASGAIGKINSWSLRVTTGPSDPYVTTADASGHYSFSNVPLGPSYTVRELAPAGFVQTLPPQGTGGETGQLFAAPGVVNFSNFPTSFVAPGPTDSFYLTQDATHQYLEISSGTSNLSPATYRVALASLPTLTFTLQGDSSVLVVDFVNGSPLPAGNITLNTIGSSNQELRIIGQSPTQLFSINDTAFATDGGGGAIVYQNLPNLTLLNCTVNASGDLNGLNNINVDSGATLNF